jgi:GNAT superfamily N-acetyltransferase
MIEIRQLTELNPDDVHRLIFGYTAAEKYAVKRAETDNGWTFTLERVALVKSYVKRYDHVNPVVMADFQRFASLGFTFGAYDGGECVGLAIASAEDWNKCYWVHELHAAQTHLRRGVGRQLVGALVAKGKAAGLRTLLCETQNTNVPAINFYLKMGFQLDGFDLSRYRNTDYPNGEIAVFMKKQLGP